MACCRTLKILLLVFTIALHLCANQFALADTTDQELGERFLDPEHWDLAVNGKKFPDGSALGVKMPWEAYGTEAFAAWKRGAEYVDYAASVRLPTLQDYLALHRKVYDYPGNSFKAYYANRAQSLQDANQKAKALKYIRAQDHAALEREFGWKKPLGELRTFGDIGFSTMGPAESKSGPISEDAANRFRQNPDLRVVEKQSTTGRVERRVLFPKGEEVEHRLADAFADMEKRVIALKRAGIKGDEFEDIASLIAADFYKRLASIHGVWDGSGRTAKLTRDWLLRHMGLPPPAFTPANDLELPARELANQIRAGIAKARARGAPTAAAKLYSGHFSDQVYDFDPEKMQIKHEGERLEVKYKNGEGKELTQYFELEKIPPEQGFTHYTTELNASRWGSQPQFTEGQIKHFNAVAKKNDMQVYGPGLYVSANPVDSEGYGPSAIQIKPAEGKWTLKGNLQFSSTAKAAAAFDFLSKLGIIGTHVTDTWYTIFDPSNSRSLRRLSEREILWELLKERDSGVITRARWRLHASLQKLETLEPEPLMGDKLILLKRLYDGVFRSSGGGRIMTQDNDLVRNVFKRELERTLKHAPRDLIANYIQAATFNSDLPWPAAEMLKGATESELRSIVLDLESPNALKNAGFGPEVAKKFVEIFESQPSRSKAELRTRMIRLVGSAGKVESEAGAFLVRGLEDTDFKIQEASAEALAKLKSADVATGELVGKELERLFQAGKVHAALRPQVARSLFGFSPSSDSKQAALRELSALVEAFRPGGEFWSEAGNAPHWEQVVDAAKAAKELGIASHGAEAEQILKFHKHFEGMGIEYPSQLRLLRALSEKSPDASKWKLQLGKYALEKIKIYSDSSYHGGWDRDDYKRAWDAMSGAIKAAGEAKAYHPELLQRLEIMASKENASEDLRNAFEGVKAGAPAFEGGCAVQFGALGE